MILDLIKSAGFADFRSDLGGFGRDNSEQENNVTYALIKENLEEAKIEQDPQHVHYELSLKNDDSILLSDFFSVLRGYAPFYNAVIQENYIVIPAVDVDQYLKAQRERKSIITKPVLSAGRSQIDASPQNSTHGELVDDLLLPFMTNLPESALSFDEALQLIVIPEAMPQIRTYIRSYLNSTDETTRQNIDFLLLAALSRKNVELMPQALQRLPKLHSSFSQIPVVEQQAITHYLLHECSHKTAPLFQFLRPYLTGADTTELLYQAYQKNVSLKPITADEFIHLKTKFWPNWPDHPVKNTDATMSFLRCHFAWLSPTDKVVVTVAQLNPANFNLLYLWQINKTSFVEVLKSNHCAYLDLALEKVNGNQFTRAHMNALHTLASTYASQTKLIKHAESSKLAQWLTLLINPKSSEPPSCKEKIKVYYSILPYMLHYSTSSILGQRKLAKVIEPLFNFLQEDLMLGAITLYQNVNPTIVQIAKSQFDSAVNGAATVSSMTSNIDLELKGARHETTNNTTHNSDNNSLNHTQQTNTYIQSSY